MCHPAPLMTATNFLLTWLKKLPFFLLKPLIHKDNLTDANHLSPEGGAHVVYTKIICLPWMKLLSPAHPTWESWIYLQCHSLQSVIYVLYLSLVTFLFLIFLSSASRNNPVVTKVFISCFIVGVILSVLFVLIVKLCYRMKLKGTH